MKSFFNCPFRSGDNFTKKCFFGVSVVSILMVLTLRHSLQSTSPEKKYPVSTLVNGTNPLEWVSSTMPSVLKKRENSVAIGSIATTLFAPFNLIEEESRTLKTWGFSKPLMNYVQAFDDGAGAVKEAGDAWVALKQSIQVEKASQANETLEKKTKGKQCPHYLSNLNPSQDNSSGLTMRFPCGLTQDSSITIIGIPEGIVGEFRIDLRGETVPDEGDPPIILHYNVRINGDKITEEAVIVQNTWSASRNWGEEERCPSPIPQNPKKVDEQELCSKMVGFKTHVNQSGSEKTRTFFPFKERSLFVATLRVGSEGFQMSVDGKHITAFAFRGSLEPWLVSELKITGDLKVTSVVANGLPSSDDFEQTFDVQSLKSPPLPQKPFLFVGVISTASNFKRRMAVRRTWMQFDGVKKGHSAVRFFVGLHKSQIVNEELWIEARTYGDIQLMPFVDYYNLITLKTLSICIFGSQVVSAKFVMKTDDDSFVRMDEIVKSLKAFNVNQGFLYGLINSDSHPHRDPSSKWYITPEEWPDDNYPPWAHGPGYVVSSNIARAVYRRFEDGTLKMFKLEDVAMGIWVIDLRREGLDVTYKMDERICIEGCSEGYVVAHYQGSREMLCLWQKIKEGKGGLCCDK